MLNTNTYTMRIGTDVSLKECSQEGYLMMDFKKRELITKGKLNPDVNVHFLAHVPPYINERYVGVPIELHTDSIMSANDVWELYQKHQKSIDETCGMDAREFPTCEYTLLSLASDVNGYCGLDY